MKESSERRPDRLPFHWIEYRHWIRSGGLHESSVPLIHWPSDVQSSSVPSIGLIFKSDPGQLSFTGALPKEMAETISNLSNDPLFRESMTHLYTASHIAPLIDEYGYNPNDSGAVPNPVRDVMFSARVRWKGVNGEFAVQMTDGHDNFLVRFDPIHHEVNLSIGDKEEPIATGSWTVPPSDEGVVVEMSLVDQQVLVSLNGRQVLSPLPFETPSGTTPPRSAVRFGARGLDVRVDQLKIYRDVYYTQSRARHGVNRPFVLGDDEYFMLGDNSPVSHDSRRWEEAPVNRSLLLGKPFLVHLPSKPGRLKIGDHEMHLRLPDSDRIRFLK